MKALKRPIFLVDIQECADYLFSEAGETVARNWKKSLDRTVKFICKFPEIGRIRQDLPIPGIRTFFIKRFPRYLVFYRIQGGKIEFLRVKQGMMHLPGLFEGSSSEI